VEPAPHTTDHAPTTHHPKNIVSPVANGFGGASIGLGFFSSIIFWWYPFGPILAAVGLIFGSIGLIRGTRGPRGENFAFIGAAICATSLSFSFTLNHVLRFLQWDELW
jgi:hypothetical protein